MTLEPSVKESEPLYYYRASGDVGFLFVIVAVPMLARLWLAATVPLTEDEAYYRLWALAPALSYLDHPPMVAWMMAAGRWIAGDSALGLRLAGVLASALSTIVLWRTAVLLVGRRTANEAALFAVTIPLLNVGAIVMTPDTPSVLFFVLGGWAIAELNSSRNANWWLAVGLFAGLGLLSKYTNFFFGLTIVIWILAVRRNWHWLGTWQLYAGGIIALALFIPVIWWNWIYGGASFDKQFGRVVDVDGFKWVWQLELWGALVLLLGPVLFWLAARGFFETARRFKATHEPESALLLALTAPLVVYFSLHALHGRVLPNWLAPAYPFFAILAAVGAASIPDAMARHRAAVSGAFVSAALTALIYAHALRPLYVSAWVKEPTQQLRGWPDFIAEVEKTARGAKVAYIATTSYGTTGQLAFHLDRRWPVFQLTERTRYVHLPEPDRGLLHKPGLVVELARRKPLSELAARFTNVEPLGSLTRNYLGLPLQTYAVYRVSNPVSDRMLGLSSFRKLE
jgi:4-amino-4-deoxy-L-arabinose transferase-like glycosyltransferase